MLDGAPLLRIEAVEIGYRWHGISVLGMQKSDAIGEPCGHFESESRVRFSTKVMNKSRTILFLSFEPHSTRSPDFVMPDLSLASTSCLHSSEKDVDGRDEARP
jgi:hypothetical protein